MTRQNVRILARLVGASGLVLALTLAPVELDPTGGELAIKSAEARGGGGGGGAGGAGGGGGGGHGGGHGGGIGGRDNADRGQGHGRGHGKSFGGGNGHPAKSYGSLDEFTREMRGSKGQRGFETARARYDEAVTLGGRHDARAFGQAKKATDLSPEETRALIERGWKGKKAEFAGGFRNHGQRVQTMVELSKRLGYGARVGAMQANFGTPFENGIADLQSELAATEQALAEARTALEAEEDPARRAEIEQEIEELEDAASELSSELDQAITDAKPGRAPDGSWATADLDVNDDGVVDTADLDALEGADGEAGTTDGSPS